jgi:TatD DNase family protein
MQITDTHCHLDAPEFEADLERVIQRAAEAGVGRLICVGTDLPSSLRCIELARRFPGRVYATVGIHPNYWAAAGPEDWERIEELAALPLVVGIGESGLDFHYTYTPRDAQAEALRRHIRLARRTDKPLIIHARNADAEVVQVLREEGAPSRGVRHCFDRPPAAAEGYLELGYHVAVGAAVTRPGYARFKDAVRALPGDRLLLETDSPYQSPASRAGTRNEPAYIVETLSAVAALRGEGAQAVADMTTRNASALFRLPG